MKKHLLFASLLLAGTSFSQTFTQANEPAIGSTKTMFLCDSNATNYASVTGTGVTWDYSNIGRIDGQTRTISVVAPSSTANAADFPGATKAVTIQNFITTYWTSTATERNSPGFVFNEPTFGEVKAVFNTDPAKMANYPFALNDIVNDPFAGTLYFEFNGTPMNPAAAGTTKSIIDGKGTLKLNATTTLTNVLRWLTIDTVTANVQFLGNVQLVRVQYEYYDLANDEMPVFTHTSGAISIVGSPTPIMEFSVVLNSVEPDALLAVNEQTKANFSVYPNPVNDQLIIKGDFVASSAKILDQTGKEVQSIATVTPGSVIEVSGLQSGIYFLVLNTNGATSVQKISKK